MARRPRPTALALRIAILLLAASPLLAAWPGGRAHPTLEGDMDGVSISGSETQCVHGAALPPGQAVLVAALRTWPIDAVRVPLNEDCWLGIHGPRTGGEAYRSVIRDYVRGLEERYVVILELHWSAPGAHLASAQQRMPDADHSIEFWREVAREFRADPWVVFEPFNEPRPPTWACWRDGCTLTSYYENANYRRPVRGTWRAAGMAALVEAIRGAGAAQAILLDGAGDANDLSEWERYRPSGHDLIAAWHAYPGYPCNAVACWDATVGALAAHRRVIATEVGEADEDCSPHFVQQLVPWLEARHIGYLAWSFNNWGSCSYELVSDRRGTPSSGYGQWVFDHLTAEARARGGLS